MCGRYTLSSTPDAVTQYFGVKVRDNFPARYNIAPSQPIAVIRLREGERDYAKRHYHLVRWGFVPEWAGRARSKNMADFASKPLINARSETVMLKPTFRGAFKRRRCLIPANGFYEWQNKGGVKRPYYCRPQPQSHSRSKFDEDTNSEALLAFAGIWETLLDPGGGEMDSAAILTTAAGEDLKTIHRREPVVLAPHQFQNWLTMDERDLDQLYPYLQAQRPGFWSSHPVSKAVGNVRHDGAELIQPIIAEPPPEQGLLL